MTGRTLPSERGNALDDIPWRDRSAINLAKMWEHGPRAMAQRLRRWDDAWAADPRSRSPIPNSATVIRPLDSSGVADLVERLHRFYGEVSGAPFVLWSAWQLPELRAHGFELLGQPPLMVRPAGQALPPAPMELRIVE